MERVFKLIVSGGVTLLVLDAGSDALRSFETCESGQFLFGLGYSCSLPGWLGMTLFVLAVGCGIGVWKLLGRPRREKAEPFFFPDERGEDSES